MLAYIIRRCLVAVPTIVGVMLFMFILFFQVSNPETIARNALGEKANDEAIAKWVEKKGYDKPLYFNSAEESQGLLTDTLFCNYLKQMASFDFGRSDMDNQPILIKLKAGVVPSLLVTLPIMLVSLVISVMISMLSAMFRQTYLDSLVVVSCVIAMSVVYFLYIIAGQFVFSKVLKWFPVSGWSDISILYFLVLPIIIGIIANIGDSTRFYRTIMIHEINADYIRTARAKGLGDMAILIRHLLRNAMLPILTRVIMLIPYLFTGSLLLESFFGIPGLGRLMVDAITNGDFATLKAGVFLSAILYIVANVINDISYTIADVVLRPLGCRDGILDEDEACDDGNNVDDDGCSGVCTVDCQINLSEIIVASSTLNLNGAGLCAEPQVFVGDEFGVMTEVPLLANSDTSIAADLSAIDLSFPATHRVVVVCDDGAKETFVSHN